MKNRFFALFISMAILSGMIGATSVFAAVPWFHAESLKFEQCQSDTVTISMDIKKTEETDYMFTLSSPKDSSDPYSTVTWANLVSFVMTSDGDLRASVNGAWFNEKTDGISIGKFQADKKQHNIRLKVMLNKRTVEMSMDDKTIHTFNIETRFLKSDNVAPCNMITVSGDSAYKDIKGYEATISSVIGTNDGELGVELAEHNSDDRTITVAYTEKIPSDLNGAVLKKTDVLGGESEIPLTVKSRGAFETVFAYEDELEKAKEYALILPDDMIGINGEKTTSTYLYFTNPSQDIMTCIKNSDYTSFDTNTDVKIGKGTMWRDRSLHKANYPDAYEIFSWQGSYGGGAQYWFGTCNWGDTDNDAIPTGNGVSEISFDIIPKKQNMSYGFSLSHTRRNNNIRNNGLEIAFDESGNIIADCGVVSYGWSTLYSEEWENSVVGKYEVDTPINIKYVIDKPNKKVYLYLNNELKKTIDETSSNASRLYMTENSYLTFYEMFGHEGKNIYEDRETLFLIDNVRLDVMKTVGNQPTVRFFGMDGKEKGAYDTISRKIDKVTVNFGKEINPDDIDKSVISLLYNGEAVEYDNSDTEYDKDNNIYTIYPHNLPPKGSKVELECVGAVDAEGNEIENFKVYATADEYENITADKVHAVNESGEIVKSLDGELYANAVTANALDEDKSVIVSISGYKDGSLKKLSYVNKTVHSGEKWVISNINNRIGFDASELDRIEISVQDFESGAIICDGYVMGDKIVGSDVMYKGSGANPNDSVLVEVYAPQKEIGDLEEQTKFYDVIVYKEFAQADENGGFGIAFDMPNDDMASGMYNVCVYADGFSKSEKILYVNPETAKSVLEQKLIPALAKGDADKAAKVLFENRYDLYINDDFIDKEIAKAAARILIEDRERDALNTGNAESVINKAVAIGALQTGKISDIIAESDVFNLDASDISEFYKKSYVTKKTRDDIAKRLKNTVFKSANEFDKALKDAFVLAVVANPVEPKSVMNVMKGLGLSGYSAAQYDYVSGNYYNSIDELKKALKSKESGGSNNGGSSGGSSVSGGGGRNIAVSSPERTDENKENIKQALFDDIKDTPWAEEAILYLAERKVINGKSEKVFAPLENVTREEFVKMVVLALDIKSEVKECEFVDVKPGEWYKECIDIAYSTGIVTGYDDKRFGTGELITREDMAAIIYRGAERAGINIKINNTPKFDDDAEMSDYARESIYALKGMGVINGKSNNLFEPKAFATRAETAKMLYELIAEREEIRTE